MLVIDDDDEVTGICLFALACAGAEPTGARDAASACRELSGVEFDVVVTDLVMPGLTGRAFLDWLAETHPGIPVVAMSGVPDQVRAAAPRSNVHATLDKPFTVTALIEAVGVAHRTMAVAADA